MARKTLLLLALCLLTAGAAAEIKAAPMLALRDNWAGFENMIWMTQRAKIGGQSVSGYVQGVGGADDALWGFRLDKRWDMLEALIGYLDTTPEGRSCVFEVAADGEIVYESEPIAAGEPAQRIRVPLRGKSRLTLRISGDKYNETAGAAFGEPVLMTGMKESDLATPLSVDIDGQRTQLLQPGGVAPRSLNVPIPLHPGLREYRVQVRYDEANHKVQIETAPAVPQED